MNTRFEERADLAAYVAIVIVWVGTALLLAACGGGGGGGDGGSGGGGIGGGGSGGGGGGSNGIAITGTAGKGLLGNAVVNVYDVTSNGTIGTSVLATGRTNDRGVFNANVNATGPIVIRVTADGQSTMLDELTGTATAVPAGLTLHTVIPGITTGTQVAVTPLTEMAFGIASVASGGLTAANIDASNSLVSTALLDGAPVVSTLPIDLADFQGATVAQQAQAKLLTALMVAASEGTAIGASGALCGEPDYHARITCMVGGLKTLVIPGAGNSAELSPQTAYVAAAYERINLGLVSVQGGRSPREIGLDTETTAEHSFVAAVGESAVLFGYDPSVSPLANTKALFADLRTHIVRFDAGEDVFGVSPLATTLEADYRNNVKPTLSGTRAVLVAAHRAVGFIEAGEAGTYDNDWKDLVCGYDPARLATNADTALCRFGSEWDQHILIEVARSGDGRYSVTTQPLRYVENEAGTPPADYNAIFSPYGWVSYVRDGSHAPLPASFTWRAVEGAAHDAMSASWQGPYFVTIDGGRVDGDLHAAQSADWDPATISGTLRVGGSLSNGAGGIELTEAVIGDGSELVVHNGVLTPGTAPQAYGEFVLERLATKQHVFSIRATIARPEFDASGSVGVPSSVTVTGSMSRIVSPAGDLAPLFNGEIDVSTQGVAGFDATRPVGPENRFVVQGKVVGRLALPNGRSLAISVAANGSQLEPTPEAPHSLAASYAYTTPSGMARIHVDAEYDATNGYTATVTTNTGVTANLAATVRGKVTGTVVASGVATATIDGTTIHYSDGTTESVF